MIKCSFSLSRFVILYFFKFFFAFCSILDEKKTWPLVNQLS